MSIRNIPFQYEKKITLHYPKSATMRLWEMVFTLGDGLYKHEASDQILIVHSLHLYVIVFRNKYCLNQLCKFFQGTLQRVQGTECLLYSVFLLKCITKRKFLRLYIFIHHRPQYLSLSSRPSSPPPPASLTPPPHLPLRVHHD